MGRMTKEKQALGLTSDSLNPGNPDLDPKYSDMVYQTGGPNRCGNGTSYKTKGVASAKEHEAALKNGWFKTPAEAIELGETDANEIKFELEQLRKEKMLDKDREELEQLRAEKKEREAKKKNKGGRPPKSPPKTTE